MVNFRDFSNYSKLSQAVEILLIGKGSERERLLQAAHILVYLNENTLPQKTLKNYNYYSENISNKSQPKEFGKEDRQGTLFWTNAQMHWKTMRKIKKCIWEMYQDVGETINS